jgi:dolichol kinase
LEEPDAIDFIHDGDDRGGVILKNKSRMTVHACALLVPLLVESTSKSLVLIALVAATLLYVLSEILRLKGKELPLITRFTLRLSLDDERTHFVVAPVSLSAGVILSLLLFPENIAYASIATAAVGDLVAAYVGERFGRTRVGRRTLEGFAAGLVASFLAASLWVSPSLAIVGSATGMLFELIGILDDNLTIPIGAGSAMFIASIL